MASETWLPIATLVLGWGGALVTEAYRDHRALIRERRARLDELQRITLLELQVEFPKLPALAAKIGDAYDNEAEDGVDPIIMAERRYSDASGKVRLLASRVEDEQVRTLALEATGWDEDIPIVEMNGRAQLVACDSAFARIGQLLRERY